jgi:hypothetical protein
VPYSAQRDDDRRRYPAAAGRVGQRALEFAETGEDDPGAVTELRVARIGKRIDGGRVHVHRRIGQTNDYWCFTIIRRGISHSHSILIRRNIASDGSANLTG